MSTNNIVSARLGVAETREVAQMLDLNGMAPHDRLSSAGYVLADPAAGQYAVYTPSGGQFRVDLSGSAATLSVEWVNVDTGSFTSGGTVHAGALQNFTAPDASDALILTHGRR